MPRRVPKPVSEASLHQAALHYLERFAASGAMVRRVLARRVERAARAALIERDDGARLVERVIARLLAAGLIDDGVFAEARSRSLRRRGASERAIRARLGAQGLSGERIQTALAALRDDGPASELGAALILARRRRIGPFRAGGRAAYRLRDLSVLARAGFSGEIARRVIDAADPDSLAATLADLSEC
jgi:regulatory protein